MRRIRALAVLLAIPCLAHARSSGATEPAHVTQVKAFLCDSPEHAIQFADILANGEIDEIAKDRVGRAAQAEVCGRYVGMAAVESEQVKLQGGTAYKVTAYRFKEDHRVAWLAERSFAPTSTNWAL